jgi:hypothetical protein
MINDCAALVVTFSRKLMDQALFDEQKLIDIVTMSDLAQSTASTAFGI